MIKYPEIYLPGAEADDKEFWMKWAVVACDQFTSQPDYWKEVEEYVGDAPSAFHLMLPEIYLEEPDVESRIAEINRVMKDYIDRGVLENAGRAAVLVERETSEGKRLGLMAALDLEEYDFAPDSQSRVRATEGTVEERIPPRMKIRKNAVLETPHVMVLINDPERSIIEPLAESPGKILYDFDLAFGGGHITGIQITDETAAEKALELLNALPLLAVGDGNHSLAAAKCHWEELKKAGAPEDHPARYAMVEIENIYDPAIVFEPIHRVLFNADPYLFFDELEGWFSDKAAYMEAVADTESIPEYPGCHTIVYEAPGRKGYIFIDKEVHELAAGALQGFIDFYIKAHPETSVDYVHGDDAVRELAVVKGNMGFYLPPISKDSFFAAIEKNGPMPRKTFSMGEAREKRYYIECRKVL